MKVLIVQFVCFVIVCDASIVVISRSGGLFDRLDLVVIEGVTGVDCWSGSVFGSVVGTSIGNMLGSCYINCAIQSMDHF